MKSPFNSSAVAACFLAVAAVVAPAISQAGSVVLNGAQVCTDTPQLSMDPSGNLQVTCTPSGGGGTTFSCPLSPLVQTITIGSSNNATITANCTNAAGPITYTWTAGTGALPFQAGSDTTKTLIVPPPFTTAGTSQYTLSVSDGTTTLTPSATINVAAAGSCGGALTTGAFTGTSGTQSPVMTNGGYVSFSLPALTATGKRVSIKVVSAAGAQAAFPIQVALAHCPGDFSPTETSCTMDGTTTGLQFNVITGAAETSTSTCTLAVGTQYYVNMRAINKDHITPSCPTKGTCSDVLNFSIQ